jgi:hypothetical protein
MLSDLGQIISYNVEESVPGHHYSVLVKKSSLKYILIFQDFL